MQLNITLNETFTSLDALEDFVRRIRAAFGSVPSVAFSAPSVAPVYTPAIVPTVLPVAVPAPAVAAPPAVPPVLPPADPVTPAPADVAPKPRRGRPPSEAVAQPALPLLPELVAATPPVAAVAPMLTAIEFRTKAAEWASAWGQDGHEQLMAVAATFGWTKTSQIPADRYGDLLEAMNAHAAKRAGGA